MSKNLLLKKDTSTIYVYSYASVKDLKSAEEASSLQTEHPALKKI
jgi:hypothetical protein